MIQLHCPDTGQLLTKMHLGEAEEIVGGRLSTRPESPFRESTTVLLPADNTAAFPVVMDTPVLLLPEIMTCSPQDHNMSDERWAEAYAEMAFYNLEAAKAEPSAQLVEGLRDKSFTTRFPDRDLLDAPCDAAAQLDAFEHLGDVTDKRVAQLGGRGVHAVKCLLAGAAEAWLVTPMHSEALFARQLAERAGLGDNFEAVVAVAEQLPFAAETFHAVYTGGCLHHIATDYFGPELHRVLVPGGKFAAVDMADGYIYCWNSTFRET